MYPISQVFSDRLQRRDRIWFLKVDIAGTEFGPDVVVDFSIDGSLAESSNDFTIGTVIPSKLTLRLRTNEVIPPNARVVPYVALSTAGVTWDEADFPWDEADFSWDGSSGTDWLPLGEFFVDSREKVNNLWVFTCYDKLVQANAPYISSLTYPATMQAVWNEICTQLGYSFDSSVQINPAYQIAVAPTGYTYRQMMGYIAAANAASVFVGKDGTIKFKRFAAADMPVFNMTPTDYIRVRQTNPVKSYTRIVVTYDTEQQLTYEAGTGDDAHTLKLENPFVTQQMVNDMLAVMNGFSYQPMEMDARGYPQFELGDVLTFDQQVSTRWNETATPWDETEMTWDGFISFQTIILHQTYTFRGGLSMSIDAPSKSDQQSEFQVEGTITGQINKLNQTAVKLSRNYFGVTITREDGLVIERDDHASKAVFNSDELTFYKGTQKALWFDLPSNSYKFTGVIEASSFIGGNITIGSGNNVFKADANGIYLGSASFGSAPFRVNMAGLMVAQGGQFSGTITASSFFGGTITGALIQTSASDPRAFLSSTDATIGYEFNSSRKLLIGPGSGGNPILAFGDGSNVTAFSQLGADFRMESTGAIHVETNGAGFYVDGVRIG